jgi:hypothetical protein
VLILKTQNTQRQRSFFCFQTTRLSRADSGGIGVCDRDRSRVEDRYLWRNSKSTLRIPAQQQRHLHDAQFFSLSTLTPRNIISRARTKQHLFKKTRRVVADGFARADGSRGVRSTRAIGTRDGDVLDAAMTTASAPHTSGHHLDRHEFVAATRRRSRRWRAIIRASHAVQRHVAARFGTRSSRETASIFSRFFWGKWTVSTLLS